MRWTLLVGGSALFVAACASIVKLDSVDATDDGSSTSSSSTSSSSGTTSKTTSTSSSASSTSSSSTSSSSSSTSSSGAPDAAVDSAPPPPTDPTVDCTKDGDCNLNQNRRVCAQDGTCQTGCNKAGQGVNSACNPFGGNDCCFGLQCPAPPAKNPFLCAP